MLKSISIAAATLALCVVGAMMLPIPGQQVAAQSAGLFVNAVDLDIVPAEREKFLAAITENGMASVKEPGCRRFDILNLGSDPNHFFLYEIYDNEAALKAHRETPHFQEICGDHGQYGREAGGQANVRDRLERKVTKPSNDWLQ